MSEHTHEEVSNTLRLRSPGPKAADVVLVVEGADKSTEASQISVPVWRGGYHDELVRLERALADGLAAAFADGRTEVTLGTAAVGAAAYPTEPLVLIVLGTVRRFLREKAGAGLTVAIAPTAGDWDVYAHLFNEFTRTMVGTR